ncbi:MAG: hypothetical protein ACI9KE_006606 [Polyangiales bacterium]|jgi:hypothetical protein
MWSALIVLGFLSACSDASTPPADGGGSSDVADVGLFDSAVDAAPSECLGEPTFVPITGGVTDIDVDGDYVFVGTPTAIEVYRFGPEAQLVSRHETPVAGLSADAGSVVVHDGQFAILFSQSEGLLAEEIRMDISGEARVALVASQLLTLRHAPMARIAALEISDIADLASPEVLGTTTIEGTNPAQLIISDQHAYTLDASLAPSQLEVVALSDPENPISVGRLPIAAGDATSNIAVDRGFVFIGLANTFQLIDASTPSNPQLMGTRPGGHALAVYEDRIASAGEMLSIYRMQGPGELEALETYATVPATALAWTPSALLVGGTDGLRYRPWNCAAP